MNATREPVIMRSRPLAASVEELLEGARRLDDHTTNETRSSAGFERVELNGERCIVKYVHPTMDFTMRVSGDLGCRPRRVWQLGLMDTAPAAIDHVTLGAAPWGEHGWGVALLMRDVSEQLVPVGDGPIDEAQHLGLIEGLAALSASMWGWEDDVDLLLPERRWRWFAVDEIAGEEALGWPEAVPKIAHDGWQRFERRAPADLRDAIGALRVDVTPLVDSLRSTPWTLLHGDWKMSNAGTAPDGRTILIDWAYPGAGPVCHELGWYLALNRSRLPVGHTKERVADDLRAALERQGVSTGGWWNHQLDVCLLGALVQFGWEKALGDQDELDWWLDRARAGLAYL